MNTVKGTEPLPESAKPKNRIPKIASFIFGGLAG